MSRVLLAMSGGVDSSASAVLLQEGGAEVVGVFMRNGISHGSHGSTGSTAEARSCCSAEDARDAAAVAERLGIAFYSIDYAEEFAALMDRFAAEYRLGRTPNPCVLCNQELKFGQLFKLADAVGAEVVATGHYARIEGGRLLRAADRQKDQSYYLFGIRSELLPKIQFPLGSLAKEEVRQLAEAAGLAVAAKAESMEICFVPGGDYRQVVAARGGPGKAGVFLSEDGEVLGMHDGVDAFTVGQRRGLPALGSAHFVKEIRAATGEVVLSPRQGLATRRATVTGVNWLCGRGGLAAVEAGLEARLEGGLEAEVQIRARSAAVPARLLPDAEGRAGTVQIQFQEEVHAVAPGQAAVFYQGALVLGGGWLA